MKKQFINKENGKTDVIKRLISIMLVILMTVSMSISLLGMSSYAASAQASVSLSDRNIEYLGRWKRSGSKMVGYWNPSLTVKFTGTSLTVKANGAFYLQIDGGNYSQNSGSVTVTGLRAGNHTAVIKSVVVLELTGLAIDKGAKLLPTDDKPVIEFIGDSITVGWDNDAYYSFYEKSFANRAAELLGFNSYCLARGGLTAVYPNSAVFAMKDGYTKTFYWVSGDPADKIAEYKEDWKFSSASHPDYVCINLGVNDGMWLDSEGFIPGYKELLQTVLSSHPDLKALFVMTTFKKYIPSDRNIRNHDDDIRTAVRELNDSRIVLIDSAKWDIPFNADGLHLSEEGNIVAANYLSSEIRSYIEENHPEDIVDTSPNVPVGTTYILDESTGFGTSTYLGQFGLHQYDKPLYTILSDPSKFLPLSVLSQSNEQPIDGGMSYAYSESGANAGFFTSKDGGMCVYTVSGMTYAISFTAPVCGTYKINLSTLGSQTELKGHATVIKKGEVAATTEKFGCDPTSTDAVVTLGKGENAYIVFGNSGGEVVRLDKVTATLTSVSDSEHSDYSSRVIKSATYDTDGIMQYTCVCGQSRTEKIPMLSTDKVYIKSAFKLNADSGFGWQAEPGQYKLYKYIGSAEEAVTDSSKLIQLTKIEFEEGWPCDGGRTYRAENENTGTPFFFKSDSTAIYVGTSEDSANIIEFTAPVCGEYELKIVGTQPQRPRSTSMKIVKNGEVISEIEAFNSDVTESITKVSLGRSETLKIIFGNSKEEVIKISEISAALISQPNTHSYTETVITAPTHEIEGIVRYTCTCGDTYDKTLARLDGGQSEPATESETHKYIIIAVPLVLAVSCIAVCVIVKSRKTVKQNKNG